jgi:hypothetical protein
MYKGGMRAGRGASCTWLICALPVSCRIVGLKSKEATGMSILLGWLRRRWKFQLCNDGGGKVRGSAAGRTRLHGERITIRFEFAEAFFEEASSHGGELFSKLLAIRREPSPYRAPFEKRHNRVFVRNYDMHCNDPHLKSIII